MIIMVNKDNKRVITEHYSAILKKLCCDAANSKRGISIWFSRLNSLLNLRLDSSIKVDKLNQIIVDTVAKKLRETKDCFYIWLCYS